MMYCDVCGLNWTGLPHDSSVISRVIHPQNFRLRYFGYKFKLLLLNRFGLLVDFRPPDILL